MVIPALARMVIMAPDPAALVNVIADQVAQASVPVPAPMVIVAVIVDMATVIPVTTGIRRPISKPRTNLG